MLPIKLIRIVCFATVSYLPAHSLAAEANDDSESSAPTLGVRFGANLGLGQATISDSAHFATDLGLVIAAEVWATRHWGVGARAAGEIWSPWLAHTNLYHTVSAYEGQLLWRGSGLHFGRRVGLTAIMRAGMGAAVVSTDESLGKHTQKNLHHEWYVCGSYFGGASLSIVWFTIAFGMQAEWNAATDWAVGPDLSIGARF